MPMFRPFYPFIPCKHLCEAMVFGIGLHIINCRDCTLCIGLAMQNSWNSVNFVWKIMYEESANIENCYNVARRNRWNSDVIRRNFSDIWNLTPSCYIAAFFHALISESQLLTGNSLGMIFQYNVQEMFQRQKILIKDKLHTAFTFGMS